MKLQDLYYGNVIPCQHDVRKDSDYAKRSLELLEMCDTLEKRLSADDKKLLNDITGYSGNAVRNDGSRELHTRLPRLCRTDN